MGYGKRIGEVIRYLQLIGYGIREAPLLFYRSPSSKLEIYAIEYVLSHPLRQITDKLISYHAV